jgi:hypothetical protein
MSSVKQGSQLEDKTPNGEDYFAGDDFFAPKRFFTDQPQEDDDKESDSE